MWTFIADYIWQYIILLTLVVSKHPKIQAFFWKKNATLPLASCSPMLVEKVRGACQDHMDIKTNGIGRIGCEERMGKGCHKMATNEVSNGCHMSQLSMGEFFWVAKTSALGPKKIKIQESCLKLEKRTFSIFRLAFVLFLKRKRF